MRFHTAVLVARAHNRYTQRVARHCDSPAETKRDTLSQSKTDSYTDPRDSNEERETPASGYTTKRFAREHCDGSRLLFEQEVKMAEIPELTMVYGVMSFWAEFPT